MTLLCSRVHLTPRVLDDTGLEAVKFMIQEPSCPVSNASEVDLFWFISFYLLMLSQCAHL